MIDFSDLPLSPNESRAARNYLGLSQAPAADQSELAAHKIKRFETGNYVPDSEFLAKLREFYEGQDYSFQDADSPGAKAKARGDVFPSGVLGKTDSSTDVKPMRPEEGKVQFMRIHPSLESDQVDRIFEALDANELALGELTELPIETGFLSTNPTIETQARTVAVLRRMAENGVLYARLIGRVPVPAPDTETGEPATVENAKTVGDLAYLSLADVQLAVVDGDKDAQTRRKGRVKPSEVLQALVS